MYQKTTCDQWTTRRLHVRVHYFIPVLYYCIQLLSAGRGNQYRYQCRCEYAHVLASCCMQAKPHQLMSSRHPPTGNFVSRHFSHFSYLSQVTLAFWVLFGLTFYMRRFLGTITTKGNKDSHQFSQRQTSCWPEKSVLPARRGYSSEISTGC